MFPLMHYLPLNMVFSASNLLPEGCCENSIEQKFMYVFRRGMYLCSMFARYAEVSAKYVVNEFCIFQK